jgi:hypothetical protein
MLQSTVVLKMKVYLSYNLHLPIMFDLEYSNPNIVRRGCSLKHTQPEQYKKEIQDIKTELQRLKKGASYEELEACLIAELTKDYLGNLDMKDGVLIGVDAAICKYNAGRSITSEFHVKSETLSITHEVIAWGTPVEEQTDKVLKVGRTTGSTEGFPIALQGAAIEIRLYR